MNIINDIQTERILQESVKKIFSAFETFDDVKKDLSRISDVLGERITVATFNKLEIILSDLETAFECLDSIKATLDIKDPWKDVEKLRKTVQYLFR